MSGEPGATALSRTKAKAEPMRPTRRFMRKLPGGTRRQREQAGLASYVQIGSLYHKRGIVWIVRLIRGPGGRIFGRRGEGPARGRRAGDESSGRAMMSLAVIVADEIDADGSPEGCRTSLDLGRQVAHTSSNGAS